MKKILRNKKIITILIMGGLVIAMFLLSGCEAETINENENNEIQETTSTQTEQKGKCLEYTTEYKFECGVFTCSNSFCCERKYDVCIRWEEDNREVG